MRSKNGYIDLGLLLWVRNSLALNFFGFVAFVRLEREISPLTFIEDPRFELLLLYFELDDCA